MKLVKTRLRSRLGEETLDQALRVCIVARRTNLKLGNVSAWTRTNGPSSRSANKMPFIGWRASRITSKHTPDLEKNQSANMHGAKKSLSTSSEICKHRNTHFDEVKQATVQ